MSEITIGSAFEIFDNAGVEITTVASMVGVSNITLYNWRGGRVKKPHPYFLKRFYILAAKVSQAVSDGRLESGKRNSEEVVTAAIKG